MGRLGTKGDQHPRLARNFLPRGRAPIGEHQRAANKTVVVAFCRLIIEEYRNGDPAGAVALGIDHSGVAILMGNKEAADLVAKKLRFFATGKFDPKFFFQLRPVFFESLLQVSNGFNRGQDSIDAANAFINGWFALAVNHCGSRMRMPHIFNNFATPVCVQETSDDAESDSP